MSGLFNLKDSPLLKIKDEEYNLEDYSSIFTHHSLTGKEYKYYKYFNNPHYLQLKNPGVTALIMYQKSNSTGSQLNYKLGIHEFSKNFNFPYVQKNYNFGDASVSSNSTLIPGIKWAYENHNQINSTANKVKIIFK